jgi:RecJ-like exonuclease
MKKEKKVIFDENKVEIIECPMCKGEGYDRAMGEECKICSGRGYLKNEVNSEISQN